MVTGRRKYGVGLTCMSGRVWILFEGRYYSTQQRRWCGYNSRVGTNRCAGTILGIMYVVLIGGKCRSGAMVHVYVGLMV